jgi:hypothetical protein
MMEQLHRRSLPHWFVPGAAHFVTYRLAGTLPIAVIDELKAKKNQLLKRTPRRVLPIIAIMSTSFCSLSTKSTSITFPMSTGCVTR